MGAIGHSTLVNCIFRGNTAPAGPQIALNGVYPADITVSYSNVEGGEPDIYVQPGFTLIWGPGNIDEVPLLVDPDGADGDPLTCTDNDYRLAAGSPGIDVGDNTALPLDITTDLAGNPRFVDDRVTPDGGNGSPPIVDIGAYEHVPCPWDCADGDGEVTTIDFFQLIAEWGMVGSPCDFDDNGVDVVDFFDLIGHWGTCP
jgi:hypothetical protein